MSSYLIRLSALATVAAACFMQTSPLLAHPASEHDDDQTSHVSAARALNANKVTITTRDGYRYITSNGIPDHKPGQFPTRGNPNTISEQDHEFRVPLKPTPARNAGDNDGRPGGRAMFGIALNGVPFEPGTAEIWTPNGRSQGQGEWRYEALTSDLNLGIDDHNAHVQPTGMYHYHALPVGLYKKLAGKSTQKTPDQMVLLAWAADGYPVYGLYAHSDPNDANSPLVMMKPSYQTRKGNRPAKSDDSPGGKYDGTYTKDWQYNKQLGDLDQHNGRTGVTPEFPEGTYYYMLTSDYPFVPRSHQGTPDDSFMKRGGGPGGGGPGGERGERPPRGERGERGNRPPPRR